MISGAVIPYLVEHKVELAGIAAMGITLMLVFLAGPRLVKFLAEVSR